MVLFSHHRTHYANHDGRLASDNLYSLLSRMLLAYLWATFLVPETANVSLEEMDTVFHSSVGHDDTILKYQARL